MSTLGETSIPDRIRENVATVRECMAAAERCSGREPGAVKLIGVTKYVAAELTAAVIQAGVLDVGESRPQDLVEKQTELANRFPDARWHLIGSLQRNKARRVLASASLIQSADRWKLIQFLDSLAEQEGLPRVDVLLEVNVSGDPAKHGLTTDGTLEVVERLNETPRIRALGLMAMGGRNSQEAEVRAQFAKLRALDEQCRANAPPNAPLGELSMGMSGDYEIAIEEGATMVRVGSSLFAGVSR